MSIVEQDVGVSAPPRVREDAREERARVLEAAALEIEVRGWNQGGYKDSGGRVCFLGAMLVASGLPIRGDEATNCSPIGRPLWGDSDNYERYEWNDAEGRTADEVTFLLRWRAEEIRDGR